MRPEDSAADTKQHMRKESKLFLRRRIFQTPESFRNLKVLLDKEYLKSTSGILKIGQLVSLIAAVSSLVEFHQLVSQVTPVYYVFLVICISTWLTSCSLLVMVLFSCHHRITNKSWNIFMCVYCAVTDILLLVVSSLLAAEAAKVKSTNDYVTQSKTEKCLKCSKINTAAVFGFIAWIFLLIDFIQHARSSISGSRSSISGSSEPTGEVTVTTVKPFDASSA